MEYILGDDVLEIPMEQKESTMKNNIRAVVTLYVTDSGKIPPIKLWRTVFGTGLKEAKDAVESILDNHEHSQAIVCTLEQYGMFKALMEADNYYCVLDAGIKATEIFHDVPDMWNMTK